MATEPTIPAPEPTVADIQAEVAAARDDLIEALGDLMSELNVSALAQRAGDNVRAWFTDGQGAPRADRIAIVGGVAAGLLLLRAITRRR